MPTIICDGDSWVFGCEIVDPVLASNYSKDTYAGNYDYLESNDRYRRARIFPTFLSELFDAEVINLSWPADDNGTILNRTIDYITNQYLVKKLPVDDLLVIVGWSSPERICFWYKDDTMSRSFRLWPQVQHFDSSAQKKVWDLYTKYLWHAEEYMPRYVHNVIQLQNFCNAHNIKWICFNSFYQEPNKNITEWTDLSVEKELRKLKHCTGGYQYTSTNATHRHSANIDYVGLWDTVDPIRFYKKDQPYSTFKSFITQSSSAYPFIGFHPSPESHKLWAEELHRYITENNLV